jgi:hypothetical protein
MSEESSESEESLVGKNQGISHLSHYRISTYTRESSILWTSKAIPGAFKEMRTIDVRKDISFRRPQRNYSR